MSDKARTDRAPAWLKPTTDFGPLLVFFAAYFKFGFLPATAAIMVATLLALAVSWLVVRRVPLMPVITAVILGIFGGLTLWSGNETFLKMKPTIVMALFSVILLGGLALGRPLLKPLMDAVWAMDEAGWRKLTLRYALFFAAVAVVNEAVWRTQSTDFWVTFKVFGIMGLTLVFVMTQLPLMQRHALPASDPGNKRPGAETDRSDQQ